MARVDELKPQPVLARRHPWRRGLCLLLAVLLVHLVLLAVLQCQGPSNKALPLRLFAMQVVGPALSKQASATSALSAPPAQGPDWQTMPLELSPLAMLAPTPVFAEAEDASEQASEMAYWPRSLLSVVPLAQQEPQLEWPKAADALIGSYVGVLRLFIDESGAVQRVQMDDPPLPEALALAAQQAFQALSFRPGELGGQKVKSWIRVEVRFDAEASRSGTGLGL